MNLNVDLKNHLPILGELTKLFAPHQIMLVGGAVRDAILGVPNDDLDFATSALPTESEVILRAWGDQYWDPGASYGTVCAVKNGVRVEVTTFRKDTYDPDSRKPEVEFGDNIWDDLHRRDFCVNALAVSLSPAGPVLYSLPGALDDLTDRVLVTPDDDPYKSFSDDPLRVFRAARFAAQLGFTINVNTFHAMATTPIDKVAVERIVAELDKLLLTDKPYLGTSLLEATDVLEKVIPGIETYYWLNDTPARLKVRWAALLLPLGPVKAAEVLKGLKHSRHIIHTVPRLIALVEQFRARGNQWDAAQVRKFWWDAGDLIISAMDLIDACENTNEFWRNRPNLGDISDLAQPLTGADVMDWLNIKPGPLVGKALKHLQNRRLEYGPMSNFEAYRELSLWWEGKA